MDVNITKTAHLNVVIGSGALALRATHVRNPQDSASTGCDANIYFRLGMPNSLDANRRIINPELWSECL